MVQVKGTRSESQRFKIERAGKRKYSAPRLLSARGEEAARRAMPTLSAPGSGGDGTGRSVSRWHGTGGNRGRDSFGLGAGSSERAGARRSVRLMSRVAIARLPDVQVIFALYSPVKQRFVLDSPARSAKDSSAIVVSAASPQTISSRFRMRRIYSLSGGKRQDMDVGILIIDADAASQAALGQVLGAEGWFVEGATSSSQALQKLAQGKWSLVLANIGVTGITGALFVTLKELAMPSEAEAAKARVRILFVVPEGAVAAQATALLEEEHLPYVLKPVTFHDLLERVSDLLMETQAIGTPLRKVRQEGLKSSGR